MQTEMTRINSDLNFNKLSDQLILSELGEITRVFDKVLYRIENNIPFNDIPEQFTLGTGHVKFFYNRVDFILDRYTRLRKEYKNRTGKEYSIKHLKETMARYVKIRDLRRDLCGWYVMTPQDEETVLKRLKLRQKGYKREHTYFRKTI